jgi:hypothetical protein
MNNVNDHSVQINIESLEPLNEILISNLFYYERSEEGSKLSTSPFLINTPLNDVEYSSLSTIDSHLTLLKKRNSAKAKHYRKKKNAEKMKIKSETEKYKKNIKLLKDNILKVKLDIKIIRGILVEVYAKKLQTKSQLYQIIEPVSSF